jgi:hypothetical protein
MTKGLTMAAGVPIIGKDAENQNETTNDKPFEDYSGAFVVRASA